jgi:hypothetical protein
MAVRQKDASKEALSRLPELDIHELREEWCCLYKADALPHLSRELLIRAVAYRIQEVALGGLSFVLEHGYCMSLDVTDPNGMIVELTVDAPNADTIAADRRNDAHSELKRWLAGDRISNNSYR